MWKKVKIALNVSICVLQLPLIPVTSELSGNGSHINSSFHSSKFPPLGEDTKKAHQAWGQTQAVLFLLGPGLEPHRVTSTKGGPCGLHPLPWEKPVPSQDGTCLLEVLQPRWGWRVWQQMAEIPFQMS